jgi:hypothetical protein
MALYYPWLITRDYVRQHRKMAATETADDALLDDLIAEASGQFISAIRRLPMPYIQTRYFDYGPPHMKDVWTLLLDEDLLAVSVLTNGDGTVIVSSEYVLESANEYPKFGIRLKRGLGTTWVYDDTPEQAISIAGVWGYAPHYPSAWKPVTTLNGAVSSTTATAVVVASDASIEVGATVKADSETMFVSAKSGNTLTVERGTLGTTAATHLTGAAVSAYQQLGDVVQAVREMVVYMYKAKDRVGGRVSVFNGGTVVVEELDPSVQRTVNRLRRDELMGIY